MATENRKHGHPINFIESCCLALFSLWLLTCALGAAAPKRKLERFRFEMRKASRLFHQVIRIAQFYIDQPSALGADGMVMAVRRPVVPACTVTKLYLGNVPGFFQEAQAVINGRERNGRKPVFCRRKNLIRGQMFVGIADNPQNHLTLPR